jgi:hypothetical protein
LRPRSSLDHRDQKYRKPGQHEFGQKSWGEGEG